MPKNVFQKGSLLLLATTFALAAMPAPAFAGAGDAAVTETYLQANYALVRVATTNLATGEAALKGLHRQVKAQCPRVAAGSPEDRDAEQLSDEVVGAMSIAAIRSDARAVVSFDHTVEHLHWSNRTLTRTVTSYAAKLHSLSKLPPPHLCADVQAWTASGFQTLPPTTLRFDRRFSAVEVALGDVPARLLAPYERPTETTILHRTHQLEMQLAEAEARALTTWGQILETFALNP
jgi:hypothetical protein